MKEIPLTKWYVTLVDDQDYERLSRYNWYAVEGRCGRVYARRHVGIVGGKVMYSLMHREILGLEPGDGVVDHAKGNGLDNRRENLRKCTQRQNRQNSISNKGKSVYKGVSLNRVKKYCYWRAVIQTPEGQISLGQFKSELGAAAAYNEAARKYFGEFAYLNKLPIPGQLDLFQPQSSAL